MQAAMALLRLPARHRFMTPAWRMLLFAAEARTPDESEMAPIATSAELLLGDFEAFFARHEREVVGYLWRMTGDEQAARDLTQETFLRAWQRFDQLRGFDQPKAWLFRVATHLALNHLRDQTTGAKAHQAWS